MRLLFAEDDRVSRRRLAAVLRKWGYEVIEVQDGNQAWEVLLTAAAPQLAILDWMMPGMDGPEVCRRVRQLRREPYIYVLLLTAKAQKEDVVAGLESGADDYLTKPVDIHELQVRLRAGRRILELQEKLIVMREELRMQATRDALTGLWNRAAIFDLLRRETARAQRGEIPLSIAMADVDHFKRVNDVYGHLIGDIVLQEVARRVQAALRPYDEVGRYGGEELLLIFPQCNAQQAVHVAERLRRRVAATPIVTPEGEIVVTLSVGVAPYGGGADAQMLLRAADEALYRAKQQGRNCVVLYPGPQLPAEAAAL
ncbi:MAG: diguanylate cyclase [Candidatus Binatia bacterium]|nr:diguanylate cyclase [Candidatus Binatia bacterium]